MGEPIDNRSDHRYSEHMTTAIETKANPVGARHMDGSACTAHDVCERPVFWEGGTPTELEPAPTATFRHHAGQVMDTVDSGSGWFYSPRHGMSLDADGWARLGWTLAE